MLIIAVALAAILQAQQPAASKAPPVPVQDTVHHVHPGHVWRGRKRNVNPSDGCRDNLELPEQHEDENQGPPEVWHRTGQHPVA